MTDRELMQQALDALSIAVKNGSSAWSKNSNATAEALRARLAQPEQEPMACIVKGCSNHRHEGKFVGDLCDPCHTFITTDEGKYSQAYRNSQREWQGLTDEEMMMIYGQNHEGKKYSFGRAIEAKLKEKNSA